MGLNPVVIKKREVPYQLEDWSSGQRSKVKSGEMGDDTKTGIANP